LRQLVLVLLVLVRAGARGWNELAATQGGLQSLLLLLLAESEVFDVQLFGADFKLTHGAQDGRALGMLFVVGLLLRWVNMRLHQPSHDCSSSSSSSRRRSSSSSSSSPQMSPAESHHGRSSSDSSSSRSSLEASSVHSVQSSCSNAADMPPVQHVCFFTCHVQVVPVQP
jgi:hypothetical protein